MFARLLVAVLLSEDVCDDRLDDDGVGGQRYVEMVNMSKRTLLTLMRSLTVFLMKGMADKGIKVIVLRLSGRG